MGARRCQLAITMVMGAAMACASQSMGSENHQPRGSALEADISLTGGPGEIDARYQVRGTTLSLLLPRGEDGAMAGLFRVDLGERHPLVAALANLPASVSGPPARPGTPVLRVAVRDSNGKHPPRQLTSTRPPVDSTLEKLTGELGRCEQKARSNPIATLALELAPVSAVPGKGTPLTVKARLTCKGVAGAVVRLNPGAVLLQAAAEPEPPTPGVTPLPLEWALASAPTVGSSPREIKAGGYLDLALSVNAPASMPRLVRAVMNGVVTVRAGSNSEDVRMSLTSTPVRIPPRN
jgi:hypothetical protein